MSRPEGPRAALSDQYNTSSMRSESHRPILPPIYFLSFRNKYVCIYVCTYICINALGEATKRSPTRQTPEFFFPYPLFFLVR